MSAYWTPTPGNSCASICTRPAAVIAFKTKIGPGKLP